MIKCKVVDFIDNDNFMQAVDYFDLHDEFDIGDNDAFFVIENIETSIVFMAFAEFNVDYELC